MKRAPMVLCLGLMLIFVSVGLAEMTPEKAAMYENLNTAISNHNDGVDLTPAQQELLERSGYFGGQRNELDHLGGPDDFGYSFIDSEEPGGPVYEWVDISETGTAVTGWSDDITMGPYDIGFDFPFYGEMYSQVWLCSNGWMSFNEYGQWDYWYWWDDPIPFGGDSPNNAIYWCWQDLFPAGQDVAYYGDDGNGNTVFQFDFVNGDGVEVEVILSPDGTILIQYGPDHINEIGWNGTRVALENADGTIGIMASDAQEPEDWPHAELAVLWELLDMGTVEGTVTDIATLAPIAGAEVGFYIDGVAQRTAVTDEEGHYAIMLEIGDYDAMAGAFGYEDSESVPVTVVLDETVTVNFALEQGAIPEISIDPEALSFTTPWMGMDSDVITVSNLGGLDLEWTVDIELIEEEVALANPEEIIARRRAAMPELTMPNWNLQEASPGVVIDPDYAPRFELDEGPYLIMGTTPYDQSLLAALNNLEIEYTFIQSDNYANVDLTEYGTLICGHDGGNPQAADAQAAVDFMAQGGTLMYFGGTSTMSNAFINNGVVETAGTGWRTSAAPHINIVDPGSDLAVDVEDGYTFANNSASYSYIRYVPNEDADVAVENGDGYPILFAQEYEDGNFIVFANSPYSWYWDNPADNAVLTQIMNNMIYYTGGGWLSIEPTRGLVAPNGEMELIATADASQGELLPGIYEAMATFSSDFPNVEPVTIWATLEVLEPGSIAGSVTNSETGLGLPGAEIRRWVEGEYVSYFCDDQGNYEFPVGEGTHTLTAVTMDYYESEPVDVDVLEGLVTQQDFALDPHIPPEILPDPDALFFTAPWMGTDSDVLTISNLGGLDLNWDISVEYLEEDVMARVEFANRIQEFKASFNHPVHGTTIYSGPSSNDIAAFPVERTANRFSELDDPYFLLFQDQTPWNNSHQDFLNAMEIPFDLVGSAMMANQDLDDYTVVMLPSTQGQNYYNTFANSHDRFEDWVNGGGWLEFHGCTQGATWTLWDGTQYIHQGDGTNMVVEPEHPMMEGIPGTFTGTSANHGYMNNIPDDALVIITDSQNRPVLIETRSGRGNMVITTETWEFGVNAGQVAGDVMHNAIIYCAEAVGGGWLIFEPGDGTIPPAGEMESVVTADASMGELDPGTYEAIITIESDHHLTEAVTVWATLTVLDPGSIAGSVSDEATGDPLPGAEIRVWVDEVDFMSYYCDEFGDFSFPIGAGVHSLTAIADNYYESEVVDVPVIEGVVTEQDFGLDHHIPPEIVVDPENFLWEVPWLGNTSDVMTIGNIGGLDLNWDISIEYIEEEEMAGADVRRRVRENFKRTMPNPGAATIFDGNTQDFINYFSTPTQERHSELDDPYFLLVQDTNPWGYTSNIEVLEELEIPFDLINSASLADTDLGEYTVIMCAGLQNNTYHINLTANYEAIEEYVSRGGWFQFCGSLGNTWTLWDGTQANTNNYSNTNTVLEPDHPMMVDLPPVINGNSANHGAIMNYPEDATILMVGDNNDPTLIEYEVGRGNVIVTTQTWEFYWQNGAGDDHPGEVLRRACAYSAEFAQSGWLDVEPGSGVIAPDGQEEVTTLIDAAPSELDPGTYEAMITVEAEHPDTEPVTIFATLVVGLPGVVEGTITDLETGGALAGAEVIIWDGNGEYFRSVFTNENGQYTIFVGGGTWDMSAHLVDYYDSDVVEVVAVVGEITVQNFELFHHIPPTIDITLGEDLEALSFFSPPGGTDTELMNIANNGGLPLNFSIVTEYIDDEAMARRLIETGSMYRPVVENELDEEREIVLPTAEQLANAPVAKKNHYRDVARALEAKENGEALTKEMRDLIYGAVPSNNELDNLGGPDDFGYYFMDSNEADGPEYEWVDISETGTEVLGWSDDITLGPFDIDFDFPFYGEEYNQFWACSNGWITFSAGQGVRYWWNFPLPETDTPNNAVYFFWCDLFPSGNDRMYYGMSDAGDFVIQYEFLPGCQLQAEIILRRNGAVVIQYGPDHRHAGGWNGTRVAIENQDGTVALVAADEPNGEFPLAEQAVAFYETTWLTGWLEAEPRSGIIEIGEDLEIQMTANSQEPELAEGIYEGMVEISATHPDTPPTIVWAEYIVGAGGIFHPVAPTGIPYPIILDEVFLNGQPIGPDAGVAVYDGEVCVGALTTSDEWPRTLIAWEAGDPERGLEGFTPGNPMTFMIWTQDLEEGPINASPTYLEGDGTFGALPYTRLSNLSGAEIPTLNLGLQGNYFELISSCIIPDDLSAAAVFGDVADLAIVYQDNGGIFIPPAFNTIGNIILTEGQKIFCFENSSVTIEGEIMDPTTVYNATGGIWNWVGYPFYYGVPVNVALSDIADDIQIVMTDDGSIWIPGVINNLGNMAPGEGYFIFPLTNLEFVYNDGAIVAAGSEAEVLERTEVEGQPAPTGLPYAVLVSFDDEAMALEPATIEIYDGTQLVGKDVVLDNKVSPVITWQGDADYNLAGFTPGNNLRVIVRSADGSKLPLIVDGAVPSFGEGAYANTAMKVAEMPTEFAVEQGYPNPFNPSVTVPFAIPVRGEVSFTVFNVLGQQVYTANNTFDAGFHRFTFDAGRTGNELVSGMYFLKVDYQGRIDTQKLMLLK